MITNQDYIDRLKVLPSNCDCINCQNMCQAPCCMSVEDAEKLIDAGYANRLMFDDLPSYPDGGDVLKPAMKGYEGKQSPWATRSEKGCTFWTSEKKCELHDKGLKPIQGKIAHHALYRTAKKFDRYEKVLSKTLKEDWESERGLAVIEKWKKLVDYKENEKMDENLFEVFFQKWISDLA